MYRVVDIQFVLMYYIVNYKKKTQLFNLKCISIPITSFIVVYTSAHVNGASVGFHLKILFLM